MESSFSRCILYRDIANIYDVNYEQSLRLVAAAGRGRGIL